MPTPRRARGLLRLTVGEHRGWPVLALAGDCDIATTEDLRQALARALRSSPRGVILDLSNVTFFDAGCVGVLLDAVPDHRVVVANAPGIVMRVLTLLDPDLHLARYPDVAAAAAALSRRR